MFYATRLGWQLTKTTDIFGHFAVELKKAGAAQDAISGVLRNTESLYDARKAVSSHERAEKDALLIRNACDALQDITFGARAGLALVAYSNLIDYVAKYSKNLEAAILQTSKFHAVDSPALGWELQTSGNHASLKLSWKDGSFAKYHRYVEFNMFAALARIRTITQTKFSPIEIRFQHEVGVTEAQYSKLAECPVIFGTSDFEMLLSLPSLNTPIPTFDEHLVQHLAEYCQRLLADRRPVQRTLSSTVEGLLLSELPTRMLRSDEAAAQIGMSSRTFARRLNDEGTTFREIADSVRCDLAKTLIKDNISLSKIAYFLGYGDQAAFSTAFKRWTGTSPNAFR